MKRVILPISIAALVLSASTYAADDATPLAVQVQQLSAKTKKLAKEVKNLKKQHRVTVVHQDEHLVADKDAVFSPWHHYVTVTTTPFLGRGTLFDGSDLLVNMPSMNEDLRLLKQKTLVENEMRAQGYSLDRPILQLSGEVEGELFSTGGFGTQSTDGMSLSTAELDLNAIASSWATAFMAVDYNGSPISSGNREPNSTLYLSRGFVTIGDLNQTPIYFTGGLMYVPFGRYANGMVSTPLTISVGKIRTPAALVGFSLDNGLFGSVYGYSGNQTSGHSQVFKQGGANLGFKNTYSGFSYTVGGGWVSNIADAQGQQNTGNSVAGGQFGGFAVFQPSAPTVSNNNLVHRVDAYDVNAKVGEGPYTLIGEYIASLRHYDVTDLTYNGGGAQPKAMHLEVDYILPWFPKDTSTSIGFSYGNTWNALGLNLPKTSYAVFLNTSIWRETTESIEFRHDVDYRSSATASGRNTTALITGTGKSRNSVVAEVGVYF